ncbi:P-loop containing nucleoside triphosphate hydrolase protein [Massarina eburnea CBS 473.64]|uniref:ATP-dependent RNA helicase n=1 Tax=Massarina eburnea CBS 473.64 TaxID=1395130 RepID=A0A6A6S6S9_9PLEO|nr:P-loop containing nucleoside triphosphate hydrolase protein [Massarina eburnea CBS 473.64]
MPALFNRRFVPPSSATKKQVASSPQPKPTSESPRPSQKDKTSKKRTIEVPKPHNAGPEASQSPVHKIPAEETLESPRSAKEPKKQKKRKRDLNVEDDAATPKKHKNIFSKFEKVSKSAHKQASKPEGEDSEQELEPEVLRDLEPLPQPAHVPDAAFEPTFSVLPSWLAQPRTIEASKRTPFTELGVQPEFVKKLEKQGFTDALAVQSALLPMLHPGYEQYQGDICVSAKTGSGKTLAYLLPIIEALKDRITPVLSAIIVVPTRQLVDQALQTAEELCAGTKIRVGTALGSVPFATEQKHLVNLGSTYDPKRAQELHERFTRQWETGFSEAGVMDHLSEMLTKDHVPRYDSGVDILICTPGRLVEHIESTTGFLLRSVRWLVIDEADQLLGQNFQDWTSVLMDALHGDTPKDLMNAPECLLKQRNESKLGFSLPDRRQITKVVLSATMETDLTKLGTLRLKRPTLVSVLEDVLVEQTATADGENFELPSTLDESAVPVGEGSKKPLYLLWLLLNHIFPGVQQDQNSPVPETSSPEASGPRSIADHTNRVLIFTKSNENASRLAHLLSVLEPSLKTHLKTMTPSSTSKAAKKLLRSFSSGAIKILIASDAASRGLDIPDISHVINYDIPTGVTSYVHRVGRTARAGKPGEAWTLFTKTEAAWFWNQLARGDSVRRGGKKIRRVEFRERDVTWNRKRTYDAALAELQGAVVGTDAAE